jgi:hypothetical protein
MLAAPAMALAEGRPSYCGTGWGRSGSGLSDAQRQICAQLSPLPTEPQCDGQSDACRALDRERQAEAAELGIEAKIIAGASPRLKDYFSTMDGMTMRLVAASRANACGLRSDQWYNNLMNVVWLLGVQERRRLGLSAAETETANKMIDLRFKRLGQPRCSEFTVTSLRQLDAFADQVEHAFR